MSRRDKFKKWVKESKSDVKEFLGLKGLTTQDGGASRPTTSGTLSRTGSFVGSTNEEANRFTTSEGVAPPAIPAVVSSQRSVNVNETPDGNSLPEQAPQPAAPVEALTSEITGPTQSDEDTGPHTNDPGATTSTITSPTIPGAKAPQQADGVTMIRIEGDEARPVEDLPARPPQGTENSPPAKWKGLRELSRVLEPVTNIFGPVKEMVDMLVGCVDTYQAIIGGLLQMSEAAQAEYDEVQAHLEDLLQDLAGHFSQSSLLKMTKGMESICGSIKAELQAVQVKLGRNLAVRYLEAPDEVDAIVGCYRRIESHLRRLALNANMEMWKVVEEQAAESRTERMASQAERISARVNRLPSALPAWYDSAEGIELKRRPCTAGTRVDVLAHVLDWTGSAGQGMVYWLNGMAGTGKTTIAYSVCAELDALNHLGASFFCSRLREECRDVKSIIPSIAYQLARFSRPFLSALCAALDKDQDVHGKLIVKQFDALIKEPMLSIQHTLPEKLVVVIDALDECDNKESTRHILDALLKEATDLPIRFILSSRPEPEIRDQMSAGTKSRLVLHELDKGQVQADIEKYLREGLAAMNPSDAEILALVGRAGILFIYAATAVRYISYGNFQRNPSARLRTILSGSRGQGTTANREVDQLYMSILGVAFGDEELEEGERDDMQQVLHTVICVRQPLTVHSISELLGIEDDDRVRAALHPLWSVLHLVEGSELVTTLHASFPDFMFDSARSKSYYCNSNTHHLKLAGHCLGYIARTKPQFNICGLESSYLPDEKVPDIEKRVANAISSGLLYACRYWVEHVTAASCAPGVIEQIRDFLSTRLLLWMEILNLKNQIEIGVECMKLIVEWCKDIQEEKELAELARDAKRFVEAFASNPVSRSTPHIYISMLAFWPKSAPIIKHYVKYTRGPVVAEGTALDRRQLAHLSTWAFGKAIEAMAVSHNGLHLGLGVGKDVVVVDLSSGKVVLGPLQGHPKEVTAVAFSPDGFRIVAASCLSSRDATILGWDTRSGDAVLGPIQLRGHSELIGCLSFSPDTSRIATGSYDKTVRSWNVQTGETLLRLEAQGKVRAARFSPDGRRVAAGFGKTLQVWDSQNGDTILGPVDVGDLSQIDLIALSSDNSRVICTSFLDNTIQAGFVQSSDPAFRRIAEHPVNISCIAYSPNGKHAVSGSWDRAVRIWDIETGNMVLDPLNAHTNTVTSVAFTPDGSRIISACEGGLVCTWDAQHHTLTLNSINTPSGRISCVKFSSDGVYFVTGSEEGTICIWDAGTGEMAIGPVKVHTGRISAVDFKNDRVVAGSEDGKICVCDSRSGEIVLGPFEVGSKEIKSVAYSSDGNLIATGSAAGVDVWNAQDGSIVLGPLTDLSGDVSSVRFSQDGSRVVACSWGHSSNVVVWDVSDGRNVFGTLDAHNNWVLSVPYSPNGALIASSSADCTIIIWDAHTGKKAIGPLTGHSNWVNSVSFSPDSTRLVSGSYDKTIRIWHVQTGQMLFQLSHGHEGGIMSVEYSPDGSRILSLSNDLSVRIHDARTPEQIAQSRSESDVGDWTMDNDGWVVDDQSRLLVWVPGDLRKGLMRPRTQVVVPQGYVRLKFDKSGMGESWAQGYMSNM